MTVALAIYAAVMSTIVFIWDIVKWHRSERVRLYGFVSSNMQAAVAGSSFIGGTRTKKIADGVTADIALALAGPMLVAGTAAAATTGGVEVLHGE